MASGEVLILGGYGNFGKRIVELLARRDIPVVVGGRDLEKATALANQYPGKPIRSVAFDMRRELQEQLSQLVPSVVINTCGPFQDLDYAAAEICIAAAVPYIDLADGRTYVREITALDAAARARGTLVVSGASTVPALTSAVLDRLASEFSSIDTLDFGIAPSQKAERGLATTKAILGYVGKRLPPVPGYDRRYGWQDLHRIDYPGLGWRWMANCEVPDLDLLPPRYGIGAIRFSAGMELPIVHFAIWAMSWLVRARLPLNLPRWAAQLLALSDAFNMFGTDAGGMHIVLRGRSESGETLTRRWFIIARNGHGPYIPAAPAAILARKILRGEITASGAMPCLGLFTLEEYLSELAHLDIDIVEGH